MRERKFVKFRVDMPDDTKLKIIDMKPERDLIHYIWYRLVLLCGKVNLDGELYMSKNIPYTTETLAIEFNREINQVELALDVLIGLEMVELTEHKVYCVKNFAKHQNIKVKEKTETGNNEVIVNNNVQAVDNIKDEIKENDNNKYPNRVNTNETPIVPVNNEKDNVETVKDNKSNEPKNQVNTAETQIIQVYNDKDNVETIKDNEINEPKNQVSADEVAITTVNNLKDNIVIPLDRETNKKTRKKKKDSIYNIIDEENDDREICTLTSGEFVLGKGEKIISTWTF
ncbi:putative phage replisome organizer [Clostridium saccharoperbutylacetonicum]|uniref:Phage replisome organizer n=1 Tax=Clostridium saccharoperbutylacetonicum N1-4(HMT) TaxID=931276 RepID=M1MRY2_9CLOT|nr:phage replisome organizer N-terminal domain-containing protein [Clostridium saccharoperbutylacetonicum]AGF58918.1 phage replisome organizer [Clostridium saccharoperbutylacetonicum N1-4(HMT)]NRT60297.1 putative phage replisome organizer [Clostridium saccharoperbutylacetonicum]NSB23609.1 putative phage replisome organizer [Clostridium saccharoperbutylacetonicum]NSB42980.1 putative phage replisome organizer [Clostridium saccharoperbutylacetonicum]